MEELKSEIAVLKQGVVDVNALFSNLLEAHDPILTITIRRHLTDKLRPALVLLNKLEGVFEALVPSKQGEKIKLLRRGKHLKTKTN